MAKITPRFYAALFSAMTKEYQNAANKIEFFVTYAHESKLLQMILADIIKDKITAQIYISDI